MTDTAYNDRQELIHEFDSPLRNWLLDWPSIEEQKHYWEQRDADLDKVEATTQWFDDRKDGLPF